jgi:hypothetical protein
MVYMKEKEKVQAVGVVEKVLPIQRMRQLRPLPHAWRCWKRQ